ncbi:MAG: winged helix-turn-helix transcriptional regulator [Chloroflexi bacterium]|jgi:ArsR family transcriptional regulator|nr:winged helix-turn-helix transcriptional regulator [Chloroflexota bacterium]
MITSTLTQEITHLHADLCSALADPTRLLLLYALSDQPRNVTELTQDLNVPQSNVSRHLKVLRDSGLVKATRQGPTVQYELMDHRVIEALDLLRSILRDRIQHRASLIVDSE